MRAFAATTAAAAVLAALVPDAARAGVESSIRCPGGIVSLGDRTIDLLGKCGPPSLREGGEQVTTLVHRARWRGAHRATTVTAERWTYDFGPQAFLMIVTVADGKVAAIERGGYGYGIPPPPASALRRAACEPSVLREGLSRLDVLARCGEPTLAERRDDVIRVTTDASSGVSLTAETPVAAELWTYDFGPQVLVRHVHLEDGKVVRVETGGHGYAR